MVAFRADEPILSMIQQPVDWLGVVCMTLIFAGCAVAVWFSNYGLLTWVAALFPILVCLCPVMARREREDDSEMWGR
jgi:hypothetical protein